MIAEFDPDWTIATGSMIDLFLHEPRTQVAMRLGVEPLWFYQFMNGHVRLPDDVADRIAALTDTDSGLWKRMDATYWADLDKGKTRVIRR